VQNIELPSPGKLNLFLHVLGRRADGYHDIQTLFQFVDWQDSLRFHVRSDNKICLSTNMPGIAATDNLVMKAAHYFREKTGCQHGVDIKLNKCLPVGGGMGGGSSNAATTLLALNYLWQVCLSLEELLEIGVNVGADVPFFIKGHAAWGEGKGEQLYEMILPELWYLLFVPSTSITTRLLYEDPDLAYYPQALKINEYQRGLYSNSFEPLLTKNVPEIAYALQWLRQFGQATVTGTGGVVFIGFDTKEEAGKIAAGAPPGYQVRIVKGVNHSPLHQKNRYLYSA